MENCVTLTNCRLCIGGKLHPANLVFSADRGRVSIRDVYHDRKRVWGKPVDMKNRVVAPGYLELQTNGVNGFHFTHFENEEQYIEKLAETARYYATVGVTGFYVTIPTVSTEVYKKILPCLKPREFENGASLLGAHVEGPYLAPSKQGCHNAELFQSPSSPPSEVYGHQEYYERSNIRLITVAPELPGADAFIKSISSEGVVVSMGHSAASYEEGLAGLRVGATCLTHTLNAMAPLQSRSTGLAGLISLPRQREDKTDDGSPENNIVAPYYSLIPDGHHIHPSMLALLHRVNPKRSILITDSIELAGLQPGTYPGHAQIPHNQTLLPNGKAVVEGTDTMIGGCISLQQGVRNLMRWSGVSLAEAVRTATENIAGLMDLDGTGEMSPEERGCLAPDFLADFVVLSDEGEVLETWIRGSKVWAKDD